MSDNTAIEWADTTWNPVLGCTRVSPGCDACYAIAQATIRAGNPSPKVATAFAGLTERREGRADWTGRVNLLPERLEQPLHWRKPRKVFVNSLSDLFHEDIPDEFIARVFLIMTMTPQHTFQVLTKRHGRMRSLLNSPRFHALIADVAERNNVPLEGTPWPLPNVWLGVSVETQKWADVRIPALIGTPATVRFLSCEPLLGPVDLTRWMPAGVARWQCGGCRAFFSGPWQETCPQCGRTGYWCGSHTGNGRTGGQPLSWVIVGGESGPGARPMHPAWARALREQCDAADVPFFFKQWGEWGPKNAATWPLGDAWQNQQRHRWVSPDGTRTKPFGEFTGTDDMDWALMRRVGKKVSGRELDGQVCDEFPLTAEAVTA